MRKKHWSNERVKVYFPLYVIFYRQIVSAYLPHMIFPSSSELKVQGSLTQSLISR